MLSSACRCLAWCSRRFTVSWLSLTTCISKCAAWQPVGHDDIGKSHLRWRLPCTTFKLSVYESAAAIKHPVQTQSQVLLYLESMQERCRGRGRFTRGQAWPWLGPLTLWFILNEVEGSRAQQCAEPVYIGTITAESGRSNATFKGGVERVHVMSFYGYPSGCGSTFLFSILGNLKNVLVRELKLSTPSYWWKFLPCNSSCQNLQQHEVTLVLSCQSFETVLSGAVDSSVKGTGSILKHGNSHSHSFRFKLLYCNLNKLKLLVKLETCSFS